MYDLHVPSSAYEKQIQIQKDQIKVVEDNRDMPSAKKKKEQERCKMLIEKLKDEEKKQTEHVNRVMERLKKEKESWFPTGTLKSEMTTNLLQYCLFPRCCFTASDAIYSGHFIQVLHDLKTQNFSTLITYDRVFNDVTYTVTNCTENEAHRYGRFLRCALETVMRWHSSKAIYDKECFDYPGFLTVFRKGTDLSNTMDKLDYENYRHVCHKWHFRLTKSIITCIESKNYSQIRNALIVLTKILSHFPRMTQIGMAIERRVDKLSKEEKDKRPDIYALAIGYSGQLKNKKSTWVQETEFHIKEPKKVVQNPSQAQQAQGEGSKKGDGEKSGKDGKQDASSKEDKKGHGDGDKKERKEKDKKEAKEKKEAKQRTSVDANGVSIKRELQSSDNSTRQAGGGDHVEEDGPRPHKIPKEDKPKKSEKKEKEAGGGKTSKEKKEKKDRDSSVGGNSKEMEDKHAGREERGGSGSQGSVSSSSSHRRGDEPSPRQLEDRESKRRRLEATAMSQEASYDGRSKHRKSSQSPPYEEDDAWDHERRDKKREHGVDDLDEDYGKKRKKKLNGEPNGVPLKGQGDKDYKERSKTSHSSRKDQFMEADVSPKIKTKEKREKSSSKKQKK